jgi:hypothetical protein
MDLVERLRVEILQDGGYNLHDVQSGASEVALFLPDHIEDKLALLLMVDDNTEVDGVGYRYKPTVFYVDKSL